MRFRNRIYYLSQRGGRIIRLLSYKGQVLFCARGLNDKVQAEGFQPALWNLVIFADFSRVLPQLRRLQHLQSQQRQRPQALIRLLQLAAG